MVGKLQEFEGGVGVGPDRQFVCKQVISSAGKTTEELIRELSGPFPYTWGDIVRPLATSLRHAFGSFLNTRQHGRSA